MFYQQTSQTSQFKPIMAIGSSMSNVSIKFAIEQLRASIEMKQHEIHKLQGQVTDKQRQQQVIEIDPDDYTDQFDESLDESIPMIEIGSLEYSPSNVLKNVDPIAYRCELNDFVDAAYSAEDTDEYKDLEEEIEFLTDQIGDLSDEIDELEQQIEELEE